MTVEQDTAPAANTFRRYVWQLVANLPFMRGYWGRRYVGGLMSLVADTMAEAIDQAIYARMPGHPEQAYDSLVQSGKDRDLIRFRGENDANWLTRVREAWDDYEQGGSPQQMLKVINQWGNAGWPITWPIDTITLDESVDPAVFTFELTIPYGMIDPPWSLWAVGDPSVTIGDLGLFVGVGESADISMLLYLVNKWKPQRSRGYVIVEYAVGSSVTFTV